MFTSKKRAAFDSLSVVELTVRQSPVGGAPHMKIKICYIDSETGSTYGYIDLEHNPQIGKEVLSSKTQKAWDNFRECLETDQGVIVFGDGKTWDPQTDMANKDSGSQAESTDGLTLGLGRGG